MNFVEEISINIPVEFGLNWTELSWSNDELIVQLATWNLEQPSSFSTPIVDPVPNSIQIPKFYQMNFVEETGLNMAPDSVIRLIQVSHLNRLKTPAAAGEADAADGSRLGPSPSIQSD